MEIKEGFPTAGEKQSDDFKFNWKNKYELKLPKVKIVLIGG